MTPAAKKTGKNEQIKTPLAAATTLLRENKPAQIFLCALLGVVVGMMTGVLHGFVSFLHHWVFMLPAHEHLSAAVTVTPWLLFAVPVLGGLLLGLANPWLRRIFPGDIIDPIEANAIYGGRMTIGGSLRLLMTTLISNGSGISVGMEAAYTQIGACYMSWIGRKLQLRREDVRIFVAAGAGAAIAAAYNAPLAGAFYGYELVLGHYAIAALPQVTLAALFAVLVLHVFTAGTPIFSLPMQSLDIPVRDYFAFLIVGAAASLVAITVMKAVTESEKMFARLPLPEWLRPAVGGLAVGSLAYFLSPQVLGSGQGGIDEHLHNVWPLGILFLLLIGKMAASSLSIGSGFRGGLFSASLFLGCLFGQIAALIASHVMPVSDTAFSTFILAGMGSVAAAVVGAPMTMTMLVLEMTGSFPAMTAVLAGILVSSTVTRYSFGYSFSTWRFHLKGIGISSARDVGWVRELTVEKLMRPDAPTAHADDLLTDLREKLPVTSGLRNVFLVDDKGNYKGVVSIGDLHAPDRPSEKAPEDEDGEKEKAPATALSLAKAKDFYLLPRQNLQDALRVFAESKKEELPVLAGARKHNIIGYAREAQLLRRYSQELESNHLAQFGN